MTQSFEPQAMITRFAQRAEAVKKRVLPPVGGPEREHFLRQAEVDFQDFAMIADARATLSDGVLSLEIDLRG